MVDTPGLLDRPMSERTSIAMQAIAALENVGDVLLFLIDSTESSTTPLSEQEHLLDEVRGLISERPILVVHSKSDLHDSQLEGPGLMVSAESGDGVEELRATLVEMIAADEVVDPLKLPDNWPRADLVE